MAKILLDEPERCQPMVPQPGQQSSPDTTRTHSPAASIRIPQLASPDLFQHHPKLEWTGTSATAHRKMYIKKQLDDARCVIKVDSMTNVNIVRLAKGSDSVEFKITKGRKKCIRRNSLGETLKLDLDVARECIASLTADDWSLV